MSVSSSAAQIVPPDNAPAPHRVDRITSASTRDTLERIASAEILAGGSVNTIGLDAIRRKLGDRWERKAPSIWEHVERELERTVGATGVFLRLDDINYLVAQPGEEGFAAQAVCLTVLQDVLKFFLGEIRPADVAVRTVTSIAGGEIVSAPVDPASLRRRAAGAPPPASQAPTPTPTPAPAATAAERAAEAVSGPLADHAPPPKPWQPPLAGRVCNIGLETVKREPFELNLRVEPVWNLRRGVITSFLVDRSGGPSRPEPADLEEMDVATLAYVATLMEEHRRQGGPLALHVPVSFISLATQRSRERLIRMTRSVREALRGSILLEIDLDAGVPPSRLIEVVSLVRPLCAGVLGRARPTRAAFEAIRGCGLRGVVAMGPELGLAGGGAGARLRAYAAIARDVASNVLIHGLPLPEMVDQAAAAGFTHASVAPGASPG